MITITYTVDKSEEPYTYKTHSGVTHSGVCKYKYYKDINFEIMEYDSEEDDEDTIEKIRHILRNRINGRIKLIEKLLESRRLIEKKSCYDFDHDKMKCEIKCKNLPNKLYIQIRKLTDDYNCSCSHATYYFKVPDAISFTKNDFWTESDEVCVLKYVYDGYAYSLKKEISRK